MEGQDPMSETINAETFTPYLGKAASLSNGRTLTLVSVDLHKFQRLNAVPGGGFSLILRGDAAAIVSEGTYRFAFDDGATFELYLIPVHTPSRDHQDYQIVFN
jgi:hypothetical protein